MLWAIWHTVFAISRFASGMGIGGEIEGGYEKSLVNRIGWKPELKKETVRI